MAKFYDWGTYNGDVYVPPDFDGAKWKAGLAAAGLPESTLPMAYAGTYDPADYYKNLTMGGKPFDYANQSTGFKGSPDTFRSLENSRLIAGGWTPGEDITGTGKPVASLDRAEQEQLGQLLSGIRSSDLQQQLYAGPRLAAMYPGETYESLNREFLKLPGNESADVLVARYKEDHPESLLPGGIYEQSGGSYEDATKDLPTKYDISKFYGSSVDPASQSMLVPKAPDPLQAFRTSGTGRMSDRADFGGWSPEVAKFMYFQKSHFAPQGTRTPAIPSVTSPSPSAQGTGVSSGEQDASGWTPEMSRFMFFSPDHFSGEQANTATPITSLTPQGVAGPVAGALTSGGDSFSNDMLSLIPGSTMFRGAQEIGRGDYGQGAWDIVRGGASLAGVPGAFFDAAEYAATGDLMKSALNIAEGGGALAAGPYAPAAMVLGNLANSAVDVSRANTALGDMGVPSDKQLGFGEVVQGSLPTYLGGTPVGTNARSAAIASGWTDRAAPIVGDVGTGQIFSRDIAPPMHDVGPLDPAYYAVGQGASRQSGPEPRLSNDAFNEVYNPNIGSYQMLDGGHSSIGAFGSQTDTSSGVNMTGPVTSTPAFVPDGNGFGGVGSNTLTGTGGSVPTGPMLTPGSFGSPTDTWSGVNMTGPAPSPPTISFAPSTPSFGSFGSLTDTWSGVNMTGPAPASSPKVICTALYHQGMLPKSIYRRDAAFGMSLACCDLDALRGYHMWAVPVARAMDRSKLLSAIILPLAAPWAFHIAGYWNPIGSLYLNVGLPLCRLLYRAKVRRQKVTC